MSTKLRVVRKRYLYSQEELADRVGVSVITVRRWEAGQRPQPLHLRKLTQILEATPSELGFESGAAELSKLEIDPEDLPDPDELVAAVSRLKRFYSTTPPDELRRRIDVRLRQIRTLLQDGSALGRVIGAARVATGGREGAGTPPGPAGRRRRRWR